VPDIFDEFLDELKRRQGGGAAEQGREDHRAPAVRRLLDEAEHDRTEADNTQGPADVVDTHTLAP